MNNLITDILTVFPVVLPTILAIAFFTLYERKVLASMQLRRGPNVIGIYGVLQAFADGFKLLGKETVIPLSANYILFIMSSVFMFILSLVVLAVIPFSMYIVIADVNLGFLFIFAISSLSVYSIIISG